MDLFESLCQNITHFKCDFCRSVSQNLKVSFKAGHNICQKCEKNDAASNPTDVINLPIWYDDENQPQYQLPTELSCLREAEKLLISMVSVYVPLQHLSMGQLGSKGHVCCFEKDITTICTELPRLPEDISVIRVIRKFKDNEGEITSKTFSIRRKNVLDALTWLCRYNKVYRESGVKIIESNLDWMSDNDEADLPGDIIQENMTTESDIDKEMDRGPAPSQTVEGMENVDYVEECSGGIDNCIDGTQNFSEKSNLICQRLEKSIKKTGVMDWPYTSKQALSEYGEDNNLFCKAFPWLFPGGIGDYSQYQEKKESFEDWAQRMLWYEDGRFARDKMWAFYALNVSNRKRNQSSGGFFINSWYKEGELSMKKIREDIENGNTKWLDKITYYSKRVQGSAPYWRQRRDEVYAWINHHVANGNGPPTFFITLSCAEYHWPDIKKLIQERYEIAGLPAPNLEKSYVQIVNDYTLIVQEYFQKRVHLWLETVGKTVFKIKHHWLRFEFAASRGQIHAHMLAISEHNAALQTAQTQANNDKRKLAEMLATWASKTLGMTCDLPVPEEHIDTSRENNPAKKRYEEIHDYKKDAAECLLFFEKHQCSNYCLRKRTRTEKNEDGASKKRRVCRNGAGTEKTPGKGDTDGYPIRTSPEIVHDLRNFFRLELPRNNRNINQTSLDMLQSWRANCDCQIILYDSDYTDPDPAEIAKITDYIVAYTCKGNESNQKERENLKKYIMSIQSDNMSVTDKQESSRLARMIMNRALKDKVISKQECMVQLAQLKLYTCSDTISTVSISGSYRLSDTSSKDTSFFHQYAKRKDHFDLSLHEYFHLKKNRQSNRYKKNTIPYWVGGKSTPQYPVTSEYAKSVFVIYVPWHGRFQMENRDFVKEFHSLINHPCCPVVVKMPYERVKNRVITKTVHVEPLSGNDIIDYATFSYSQDQENVDLLDAVATLQTEEEEIGLGKLYDLGKDYEWSKPRIQLPKQKQKEVGTWLSCQLEESTDEKKREDNPNGIPLKNDGTHYKTKDLHEDQTEIITYILQKLQQWITTDYSKNIAPKPLRMTIAGVAGSGKSTLINTLVTILRNCFQTKNAVKVCGPTGAAAYNAGGVTCHHAFKLPFQSTSVNISENHIRELREQFSDLICLIVDERSMISSETIAHMEYRARHCANKGICVNKEWGNIPIVILVGDDYQIPPIKQGMVHRMEQHYVEEILQKNYVDKKTYAVAYGERIFDTFANDVMFLDTSKRQHMDQTYFMELLQKARCESEENQLSKDDT